MKDFLKKVLYYTIVISAADIVYYDLALFNNNKIFSITFSFWTVYFFIFNLIYGLIFIGIIRYFSRKINKFLYKSNKYICLGAFVGSGIDKIINPVLRILIGFDYTSQLYGFPLFMGFIILGFFILYRFWKYHIEICAGIFLSAFIYSHHIHLFVYQYFFKIAQPKAYLQEGLLLAVLIVFMAITIFLRRKGIYDFRSRKDKWQEQLGEGFYKRR